MKRIIFKVSLLMIILAANIGVLYADVIIDKGDIVIICFGDGDGYGNYLESQCMVIIKQTKATDGGGGGGGGIFIPPPDPVPYIPTTPIPDPTGGGTGTNNGGTGTPGEITINDKPTIEDETEPIEPLEQICRCNTCPDCGGCILEPGAIMNSACEKECDCIITNFSNLKCIDNVRVVRKIETALTTLWSVANFLFSFIMNDLSGVLEFFEISLYEYIKVELTYTEGTLLSWSGDLKYEGSNQKILRIINESIGFQHRANLTNEAYIMFYGVTSILDGESKVLYQNYTELKGEYISVEQIERDGTPKVGEPIYREYVHNIKLY